MKNEAIASWASIAQDWAQFAETNDYRNLFLIPETLKLLGEVAGKRILDLGCGEGGYARLLARKGAHVTAVDASREFVAIAREKARREDLQITHLVRDAASLDGLNNNSYDIVLAAMSLMDIERYDEAVAEVGRVLRPGGKLLMSILHPCFTGRGCRRERDEDGNLLRYIVDHYFDKTPWRQSTKFEGKKVIFRHRPLQDYVNPLIAVGFKLVKLYEPVPTPEQMRLSPRFPELARVPRFLFMEWQRE
jgi:ubiquinone/menaquinone biosynthesis C-methylase UbiE